MFSLTAYYKPRQQSSEVVSGILSEGEDAEYSIIAVVYT